jgi:hypothetical protein
VLTLTLREPLRGKTEIRIDVTYLDANSKWLLARVRSRAGLE